MIPSSPVEAATIPKPVHQVKAIPEHPEEAPDSLGSPKVPEVEKVERAAAKEAVALRVVKAEAVAVEMEMKAVESDKFSHLLSVLPKINNIKKISCPTRQFL